MTDRNLPLNAQAADWLRIPIEMVWSGIASDVQEFEPMTNEERLEMCVDAGRLLDIAGDPDMDNYFQALCQRHTYPRVLAFLNDHIRLGY